MITSRINTKAQTTIPQPVRLALGLKAGDEIAYAIESKRAVLTRAAPRPAADDPFAAFQEWSSNSDIEAYGGL